MVERVQRVGAAGGQWMVLSDKAELGALAANFVEEVDVAVGGSVLRQGGRGSGASCMGAGFFVAAWLSCPLRPLACFGDRGA